MAVTQARFGQPGIYNASVITLNDGDSAGLQLDQNGNLKITVATLLAGEDRTNNVLGTLLKPVSAVAYSPLNFKDKGTLTKANLKAVAGSVFSLRITNANAAVRYFQLHNKASAPAGGDTASRYWLIPAGTATAPGILQLTTNDFAPSWYMGTGVGIAISTTADTFTDSATAADHTFDVNYV